ncbi:MAG: NAD-dependent epimerase/dehydratase family protein [Gaiellaceae bacterium]
MKALVTGAGGFVGAVLVRELLGAGRQVHVALRPTSPRWRLAPIEEELAVHLVDLADREAVAALVRRVQPDEVFHLAAHGAYSWQTDAEQIVRSNVLGTTNLVDACVEVGCRAFVNAGSSSEYGYKPHPPSEDEALAPNSAYAAAKAFATHYCAWSAAERALPAVTLRLYSAYGPWEEPRRLVPSLLTAALTRRLPPLAAPDTARDFVFVQDVAAAFTAAARHAAGGGSGVFNIGSGTQTTLADLVETVRRLFDVPGEPEWNSLPARAWDTDVWVSQPRRAAEELGWRATTALEAGLLATAEWLQGSEAVGVL